MSSSFYDAGAPGYDQIFGFASREYVPTLLRMARLAPGQHVLDIATGTGLAAEAVSKTVGSRGSVVAADISVPMPLDEARKRLEGLPNVSLAVENGQAMSFPDASDPLLKSIEQMRNANPLRDVIPLDWAGIAWALRTVWLRSFTRPDSSPPTARCVGAVPSAGQLASAHSRPGGRGWLMARPACVSKIADAMLAGA